MWEKTKEFFSQVTKQKTLTWWEEQYLNSAQNHSDLEYRQRQIEYRRSRSNDYWGACYENR
jgi:hypothetical protein